MRRKVQLQLFLEENRQWEKRFLADFDLDVRLFEEMGLRIKQIVPVRSVYRLVTDKGFYCLKKLRFSHEEMTFISEAVSHLKDNGFRNVLDMVVQKGGGRFVVFNGSSYFLTQWIDGRECDFMNPLDLECAIDVLSDLHKASENFHPTVMPENRDYLGKWPDCFRKRIIEMQQMKEQAAAKPRKNEIDRIYLNYVDACIGDAEDALYMLLQSDYDQLVEQARTAGGFIHHDYAHHNILHSFDGRTFVVDFDYCIRDIRIHDIGSLILRNMKKCCWDIDKAMYIIDSYNRKNPISHMELETMVPFFLFPQDFWMVSRQYYIENKDWEEEDYLDKMNTKSEYTYMRKSFIDSFKKRI